jgi:uncharacterized protein YjbI with pentapeptide repeats
MSDYRCTTCNAALVELGLRSEQQLAEMFPTAFAPGGSLPAEVIADPYLYYASYCLSCDSVFCETCMRGGLLCPACGRAVVVAFRGFLERSQHSRGSSASAASGSEPVARIEAQSVFAGNPEHYRKMQDLVAVARNLWVDLVKANGGERGEDGRWRPSNVFIAAFDVLNKQLARSLWNEKLPSADDRHLKLAGADLTDAVFLRWGMYSVDLQNAQLDRTLWHETILWGADFTGASIRKSELGFIWCPGVSFRNADLSDSVFLPVSIKGQDSGEPVDLSGANCTGAQIGVLPPSKINLKDAKLTGCSITFHVVGRDGLQWLGESMEYVLSTMSDAQCTEVTWKMRESTRAALSESQRSRMGSRIEMMEDPPPQPAKPESVDRRGGGCFLASAACGSEDADDVVRLREFRDIVLLKTRLGRLLIAVYESLSPPLAQVVSKSSVLRLGVRVLIVRPLGCIVERVLGKKSIS